MIENKTFGQNNKFYVLKWAFLDFLDLKRKKVFFYVPFLYDTGDYAAFS